MKVTATDAILMDMLPILLPFLILFILFLVLAYFPKGKEEEEADIETE